MLDYSLFIYRRETLKELETMDLVQSGAQWCPFFVISQQLNSKKIDFVIQNTRFRSRRGFSCRL